MDQTLKRRLIGAAILVVIAAIVLPMFLADRPEGRPDSQTLPLNIPPAPDRDLSRQTLPLGEESPAPADQPAPADRIVAVDTGSTPPAADPAPVAGEDAAQPEAAGDSTDVTASAPSPTPATAPPPPAAVEPSLPAVSADGSYWVNLGSYAQAANADRVAGAAERRGIPTQRQTVEADGRSLIRLRSGPYASRAQAEQVRQQVLAAVPDSQPKVETSSQAPTADAPAAAVSGAGAWAVQVGAFGQEANARQLSDRLRGAGFPSYVLRRGESYAVRVGPYVRRADAEAQRQRLKSDQRLDGLIVPHSG